MTFYDDRVHDFDPYLGLDFTWMDSPSSEWLQPLTEDHIDETIAHIGTGIGMEVPLIDEAAASRNSPLGPERCQTADPLAFRERRNLGFRIDRNVPSEYYAPPAVIPTLAGPLLKRKQAIRHLSIPTLETKATTEPPKIDQKIEQKPKRSKRERKSGEGRKSAPRREQNMAAQKKYRDKRVKSAHLMSDYIVKIRRALNDRSKVSSMKCLVNVHQIVDEYQNLVKELDPNLALKQDRAVDGPLNEEDDD